MAIKTILSQQMVDADNKRLFPIDDHGKRRDQYAICTNLVDAGDDGSTFQLFKLPPGRVRTLPSTARLKFSAFGAGRVLSLGARAYSRSPNEDLITEDATCFGSGLDVSAASPQGGVNFAAANAPLKYDVYSRAGIIVFAKVTGGTVPVGASLEVLLGYLYE